MSNKKEPKNNNNNNINFNQQFKAPKINKDINLNPKTVINNIKKNLKLSNIDNNIILTKEEQKIAIPFNSDLKWACFLRKTPENNFWLAMKGAPERIMSRCTHYLLNGKDMPITDSFKEKFKQANQAFALKGERVIGLSYKRLSPSEYPIDYNFVIEKEDKENPRKKGEGKEYYSNGKLYFEGEYLYDKRWNGKGYDINGEEVKMKNGKNLGKRHIIQIMMIE